MMKHSFPRQIVPCAVCVCLFLVTLLAPALWDSSSPFETMDLGTLKAQADRLQAQVDRKAADYATLRDLALILRTIAARYLGALWEEDRRERGRGPSIFAERSSRQRCAEPYGGEH